MKRKIFKCFLAIAFVGLSISNLSARQTLEPGAHLLVLQGYELEIDILTGDVKEIIICDYGPGFCGD